MNILSIEPTPSPNTMKIILSEELPAGKSNNYKKDNLEEAPQVIKDILSVEGVKGVYHVADFLAVERISKFDWADILAQVRKAFGEEVKATESEQKINDHFGEVKVFVQMFRGIPMQVKLVDDLKELRVGLPERFKLSSIEAQQASENVVMERAWNEQGVRYGGLDEVGQDVVEEISAAYPQERLNRLVEMAKNKETASAQKRKRYKVTEEMLDHEDWTKRYADLEQMDPTEEDIPVLSKALHDEKASIRRLATVYLGMIESPKVFPLLYIALKDKSVTVRRTAGDCLSDIGDKDAIDAMISALKDKNKLVRWRAAMFLYEVGDESALPALKEAQDDPEFEVSMQIKLALERIEGGEEAKGSVWKQMTESRKS
ncbi:conserved virulence factor C family protein [Litchfieldia alkalitelluris]|uniref:conserved virulence factor C family protein n=1 Tax=Litchfieldia alkalitelluris TaxID=304268 RepID=UPI000997ACA3|nr:conserved virulence factor C family protein [Litchfieldia alkalitelluris]